MKTLEHTGFISYLAEDVELGDGFINVYNATTHWLFANTFMTVRAVKGWRGRV